MMGLLAAIAACGLFAFAGPVGAAEARTDEGVLAYREGAFDTALELFLRARGEGESSDTLTFNLGLAYYRLGQYQQARECFDSLLVSPEFAVAAEYHLGLIAARTGNMDGAVTHLRAVDDEANPPEMRALAQTALERIATVPPRRLNGRATGALGFDSNPGQQSGAELGDERGTDGLVQIIGTAAYPLGPPLESFAEAHGNLYLRNYFQDDFFDQYGAELGLRRSLQWQGWSGLGGVAAAGSFLDGDYFQTTVTLNAEASRKLGRSTMTLRLRVENINGEHEFDYLDGWRHRAEIAESITLGKFFVSGSYEYEYNDRSDLRDGQQFFSQSPQRHSAAARLAHGLTSRLSLDWQARYRYSRYGERHRVFEGDNLVETRRSDNYSQVGVAARFRPKGAFGYSLDYRYNDSDSSLDRYGFSRHTVLLSADWKY